MRFTAKLLLVFLFIPLFLASLLTATFKYKFLKPDFWLETFETNHVYTNLAKVLKEQAERQTLEEGGSLKEARILTDLLTPENLKDFLEKNITYILNYANGKTSEVVVYVPIGKIPKSLLPDNLGKISETMTLDSLLEEFNMRGIGESQIKSMSRTGTRTSWFLIGDLTLLVLILALMYMLTGKGSRFTAPGLAFLFSGVFTLLLTGFSYLIRGSMLTDWVKGSEPSQIILATFAPHVLGEILTVWVYVGIGAVMLGLFLLFLRKKQ